MLTRPSSFRSWITLALSGACVLLAVLWPGWFGAFRAEGTYKEEELAVVGNVAIATASVQSANISLRLGALRGGPAAQSGGTRTTSTSELSLDAAGADGAGRSAGLGGLGFFINGLGSLGNQGATRNEPAFDIHTSGLTLGADYKVLSNLVLGLAFGYVNAQLALEESRGHVSTTGYSLSAFGNVYIWRGWYADAIVTYGWNDIETRRSISGVNETAAAHTDGNQLAVSASTGYDFAIGALTITPGVRVNYLKIRIDGYDERQTTASNLHVDRQSITSLTTSVGGQVSYAISLPFGVVSPMLRFEWEHEYENDQRNITGRSLVTGLPFSTPTNHADRNYFNLGTGATATFGHGISAFFYYETILGKRRLENHSFTGGVRYEF